MHLPGHSHKSRSTTIGDKAIELVKHINHAAYLYIHKYSLIYTSSNQDIDVIGLMRLELSSEYIINLIRNTCNTIPMFLIFFHE